MPSSRSNNNKTIGITLGDPGGIGPEIVAASLHRGAFHSCKLMVIGERVLFKRYGIKEGKRIQLIDCRHFTRAAQIKNHVSRANGIAALRYLKTAVGLLKTKQIHALVTAPVCKESIALSEPAFIGHTEYLAQQFGCRSVDMMFVHNDFRVVILTRHIPIKQLPAALTQERLKDCVERSLRSLKKHFGIRSPRVAVCGLNPHAGENGLIGQEDKRIIAPVIARFQKKGFNITGPFAADTIFTPSHRKNFDLIVAMYHDQGLAPAKALYFDKLVNVTIGLPFIRTSPDHGTGFNIAGKNKADNSSMMEAIKLARALA